MPRRRTFDLDVLRVFVAIAEHGSFSAAARVLNRTQSAVSMIVKRLEMEAGLTTSLLDRLGVDFDLVLAMHRAEDARGSVLRHERPRWAVGRRGDAACRTPLPLALAPPGCLFRDWAFEALRIADRPWRLAYVSASLGAAAAEGREDRPRTDESGFVPRARPVIFRPAEERWSEHSRSIGSKSPMARPRS